MAVAVCLVILLKTGLLQLTGAYGKIAKKTKQKHLREELLQPVRGEIVDRNGVLLATSLQFQTVAMDPFKIRSVSHERRKEEFETLERVLGVSVGELEDSSNRMVAMIPVERAVSVEKALKIKQHLRRGMLLGIELVNEQVREYPWGDYTRSILGVVRGSRDILLAYKNVNKHLSRRMLWRQFPWYAYSSISGATPQRGIGGIEELFDPWLAGTADHYVHHLDRNRNLMDGFTRRIGEGKSPCSIVLTIDIHLQRFVAQLVRKKLIETSAILGMAVVMDSHSGETLAAYSASLDKGKMRFDDNRVLTSSFEPGSVAKPLMMLHAFELGVVGENDRFDCSHPTRVGNKIYRDERRYFRHLSPEEILALSSDSGMAQIVRRIISNKGGRLSADTLSFLRRCGLGENMAINHTAISRSTLPSPEQWTSISVSQLAIGYEFRASPFHLVSAYSGFANGGKLVRPLLVKKIVDKDGLTVKEFSQERPLRQCFSSQYATLIHGYLKAVVSMKGGTGRRAAVKGIDIAGKTGTSRRLVNGRYSRKSHNSTFVGILPVDENLTVVIGVFFQDVKKGSDYGGVVCAPVFRDIAKFLLEKN
jgi:cell division protein FtsI (penicillin-binding protein 3)